MKEYKTYIVALLALAIGVLFGWLLFRDNTVMAQEHSQHVEAESSVEIWTCSMDPQVRQSEPGDCPICGMDLIPAGQTNSSNTNGFQMTSDAVKLANIQTTIIGSSVNNDDSTLKLNGKIQADETKSASLVTHIPGRIEKLFVSYTGEQVNQGQKVATIYSPDLITAQKELLEAQKIQDISPGLLNAASNKLKYWKIADQVVADILETGVIRETFDIYAENTGIVSQKKVSPGDYLTTGEVLFDIQNLDNLWALFDVYENDLAKIRVGKKISFTTPSASNKTFNAHITFVNPVINPQTRVASIRAEVYNAGGNLKPEMFISGKLNTYRKSNDLMVPKSAVLWTGSRSVVYVKIPETEIPSFEFREIEVGDATQSGYPVISGVAQGEEIVTNGAFVIDASAQLNNQTSMMNRNVTVKNDIQSSELPNYTASTPSVVKDQLSTLATTYFPLKDALVDTDAAKAATAIADVLDALERVDMALLKDKAHVYWMDQLKAMQVHGRKISTAADIEEQRKQFDFLSQALIKSLKVFGVENATFYVQHCPMANDNSGADWLSQHQNILNPYFGDKMLTCGRVQDTIDHHYSVVEKQAETQIE